MPLLPTEADTRNRVELAGFLGRPPVLRYTPGGVAVLTLSLVTYHWREVDGLPEPVGEWHRVVAWRDLAEARRNLRAGAFLRVQGRLQHHSWETRDGERRRLSEVVATEIRVDSGGLADSGEQLPLALAGVSGR
jgi:single-strand DNA-binding protein